MSKVFKEYSRYYDLINQGKDYSAEVNYVLELNNRYASRPCREILNLGCGTGRHDLILAGKGFKVTGVDCSETMLAMARKGGEKSGLSTVPTFVKADLTTVSIDRKFDLVTSLFHVVSYQTSNAALRNTFNTAAKHLTAGGLFIFDFWYGPAVLHDKPGYRIKSVEDDELSIKRTTEPVLHENDNTVEVHFTVDITGKKSGARETLKETHLMRYFFLPEIIDFLESAGFGLVTAEKWLGGAPPSLTSWYVCCVARKN